MNLANRLNGKEEEAHGVKRKRDGEDEEETEKCAKRDWKKNIPKKDEILKFGVKELREALGAFDAKRAGNKRVLQKRLIRLCDPDLKDKIENEKLVSACQKAAFKTKAPHHELYRKNFNAEDLANKRWYKTEGTDPAPVWTSKFVWGLLRVINALS